MNCLNPQRQQRQAVIFNSGTLSDLSKFFAKYGSEYNNAIREVIIMGGGFFNFAYNDFFCPGTPENPCDPNESSSQRWAGNLFAADIFPLSPAFGNLQPPPSYLPNPQLVVDWQFKPPFHTMQELNMFLDPSGAEVAFRFLHDNEIKTTVVPLDATDPILIGDRLDSLRCSPTPEGRFVYALITGLKGFEGGAFPFVIRAWDILAAIVFLEPSIIEETTSGPVSVVQLGSIEELKDVSCNGSLKNPFNVLNYNPYVGQTTVDESEESPITIVTNIDGDAAFAAILERLNSPVNASCKQFNYYLGEFDDSQCEF